MEQMITERFANASKISIEGPAMTLNSSSVEPGCRPEYCATSLTRPGTPDPTKLNVELR